MSQLSARTRNGLFLTTAAAQITAATSQALPIWALIGTLSATAFVARRPVVSTRNLQTIRTASAAAITVLALLMVERSVSSGAATNIGPQRLTGYTAALVLLAIVLGATAKSHREMRIWLSINMMVLVAAAAAGRSGAAGAALLVSWLIVVGTWVAAQRDAAAAGTTLAAVERPVGASSRTAAGSGRGMLALPLALSLMGGAAAYLVLPSDAGGGGLSQRLAGLAHTSNTPYFSSRPQVGVDTEGNNFLDLDARGSLGDSPLLRVPADSPTLWRGSIYSTYTGQSWSDTLPQTVQFKRGTTVTLPASSQDPAAKGRTATYRAELVSPIHGSLVWSPGVIKKVSGIGGDLEGAAQLGSKVRFFGGQELSGYAVTSTIATTSPRALSRSAGSTKATGASAVSAIWTDLPTELPSDVSTLARQITAGAPNRYSQVTDLEAYLRTHEQYSTNSPVPGHGQDAVADFLFRDHIGFCEQFASAEAVMLRTLGVPARVVSGLAYGTRQGSTRLITTADAHAWVEVYYPGVGWSPTDPTAGAVPVSGSSNRGSLWSRVLHAKGPAAVVAIVVLVLLAFGAATLLGRRRRLRSGPTAGSLPLTPGPVLTAFGQFVRRRRGRAPRERSETAREYVDRVAPDADLRSALATLDEECYAATGPDVAETESAVMAFSGETGSERES